MTAYDIPVHPCRSRTCSKQDLRNSLQNSLYAQWLLQAPPTTTTTTTTTITTTSPPSPKPNQNTVLHRILNGPCPPPRTHSAGLDGRMALMSATSPKWSPFRFLDDFGRLRSPPRATRASRPDARRDPERWCLPRGGDRSDPLTDAILMGSWRSNATLPGTTTWWKWTFWPRKEDHEIHDKQVVPSTSMLIPGRVVEMPFAPSRFLLLGSKARSY